MSVLAQHRSRQVLSLSLPVLLAAVLGLSGCSKEARTARHIKRGDAFIAAAKLDSAEIEYMNVLQLDPKSGYAIGRIGGIYFDEGRLGRAHPYLLRARELDPGDLIVRRKLAALFLAVGNRALASAEADFVLEKNPGDFDALMILADAAVDDDDLDRVKRRLEQVPAALRAASAAIVVRGIIAVKSDRISEATTLFEEALAADPKSPSANAAMAAVFVSKGDFVRAERAYAAAALLSGARSPHTLQYALFRMKRGDLVGARHILESALSKAPDYIPAALRLADLAASEKKFEQAQTLLTPILSREPNHPEALLVSSRIALAQGDVDKALIQIGVILRMYPKSHEAYLEAARIYLSKDDLSRAFDSVNQALDLNPHYRDAIILLAKLNFTRANYVPAVTGLQKLVEDQPTDVEASLLLGQVYRAQKDYNAAKTVYLRVESTSPGLEVVSLELGAVYRLLNRRSDARAAFEAALIRNPRSLDALEKLSEIDIEEKKMDVALLRVKGARERDPKSADIRVLEAKLNMVRGEFALAEAGLRESIRLAPEDLVAYMLLARLYIDTKDLPKAIENLNVVVQRNPKDTGAWSLMASIYDEKGDFLSARRSYESLLKADPMAVHALNNLALNLSEHGGNLETAYELARKARDLAPGDANVADTLGWILYLRKDFLQSVSPLRESLSKNGEAPESHYRLASALYMTGDEEAAKEGFKLALAKKLTGSDQADARQKLEVLGLPTGKLSPAAEALLESLLKAKSSDPGVLLRLGENAAVQGNNDKARRILQQGVEANPQNGTLLLALARFTLDRGDSSSAMELARQARKIMPDNGEIVAFLGETALLMGNFEYAYPLLQEANRRLPSDPLIAANAAVAAYSVGRSEESSAALGTVKGPDLSPTVIETKVLVSALLSMPVSPEVRALATKQLAVDAKSLLALMAVGLSSPADQATLSFEAILRSYPHFAPAKRELAFVLFKDPANDKRTIELATEARSVLRTDAELVRVLAIATFRQGDFRRALPSLESSVLRYSSDPALRYFLGVAQVKLGQVAAGRDSLRKAIQLGLDANFGAEAVALLASLEPTAKLEK